MTTVPQIAATMWDVLTTVADEIAREVEFVKRKSKLTGAIFVQTLVFGWLHDPEATLEELTQTAAGLGVAISPQGLDQRFTPAAADCLMEVLEEAVLRVVTADPVAVPLLQRFPAVIVEDSTVVSLPDALAVIWRGTGERTGHNQAALKLQVRLDLLQGSLSGPLLQDGRASDHSSPFLTAALPRGALCLRDLGFFSLDVLAAQDAAGGCWLSRLQVQTAVFDAAGTRWEVGRLLVRQQADQVDLSVTLGVDHRLPARLLAVRVPEAVANERRRKLKAEAKQKGQTVSQARLALADWTILVTNAAVALLTLPEALVLYRTRWQIELLFKLWKQHGQIDQSRSAQPWRILCEVYAKLVAMVVQHWILLASCWTIPNRSLVKAAATIRNNAALLVRGFRIRHRLVDLTEAIEQIRDCVTAGCRMNTRRKAPNTYQLLLDLTEAA